MPYKDPAKRREYQAQWLAHRRAAWFADKVCAHCGATDNLQLDHIDPQLKVSHRIWSWPDERRYKELAKCQVLCEACHINKSIAQRPITHGYVAYTHGTGSMYTHGRCRCDECRRWQRDQSRKYRARIE